MNQQLNAQNNYAYNLPQLDQKLPLEQLFVKMPPVSALRKELRYASIYFAHFKLTHTSKFLSELLNSYTRPNQDQSLFFRNFVNDNTNNNYQEQEYETLDRNIDEDQQDLILMLKNLYENSEYKKCAYFAEMYLNEKNSFNNELVFYYSYSHYMHNKIKNEDQLNENQQKDNVKSQHDISYDLEKATKQLEMLNDQRKLNTINMYTLGLIYLDTQKTNQALDIFVEILNINPFFWSAWLDLCRLLVDKTDMDPFFILGRIQNHWMKNFWAAMLLNEKVRTHENYEQYCYDVCSGLWSFFNTSSFVLNMFAVLFHNISNYDQSLEFYMRIQQIDPFRYENIDVLSNILYVKEKQNELGKLAIACFENDKYIPETCCVLGNYYSLVGEHTKAAKYFQRALQLDKNFLATYTLLGHEFLELKNVPSAIQAYNTAVKINKRDFRAWYGLGQAYELQNHMEFALYYFLQALKSNPRDSRMWNALGTCYEKLGKKEESAKCLEKAETFKDHEGISLFQLGKIYDILNQPEKAVHCFEENLSKKDEKKIIDKEMGESMLYLAYYYYYQKQYSIAMDYASKLLNFNGIEKQEAQNLIFEINSIQNKNSQQLYQIYIYNQQKLNILMQKHKQNKV